MTANLAADRPLVLVIDDLQDADPESLQFAAYLAPRISRLGCSLIAGVHGAAELADGYPDPLGFEDARVERLAALAEPTVREIVTRRVGSCTRRGATVCHWLTGGNPMLVRELVTAAEQAGLRLDADSVAEICADAPARVRHRMLGPFGPLEPDALAVARAVAVVGSAAERAPVAAITGLPEEALATAIDSLEASEILDREHPLEYVYPLLRAAVYSLIPREERGRLHARAGAGPARFARGRPGDDRDPPDADRAGRPAVGGRGAPARRRTLAPERRARPRDPLPAVARCASRRRPRPRPASWSSSGAPRSTTARPSPRWRPCGARRASRPTRRPRRWRSAAPSTCTARPGRRRPSSTRGGRPDPVPAASSRSSTRVGSQSP